VSATGRVVLALALALAANVAAADEASRAQLQAEIAAARSSLHEAELQLEQLKRFFPPEHDPAAVEGLVKRVATEAELVPAPDVTHEPALSGPPGVTLHGAALHGLAPYGRLHFFLSMLQFFPRPMDLRELEVQAAPQGRVAWRARFVLPTFGGVPEPPPRIHPPPALAPGATPEQAREAAMEVVLRRQLEDVVGRREAVRASVQALLPLAARRTARVGHAVGLLARELEGSAVATTRLRVGDAIVLEGVVLGEAARSGLRPAAEKAGLQVEDLRFTPKGACQAFVLSARVPDTEPKFDSVFRNGLFDDRVEGPCTPQPERPPVAVKGAGLHFAEAELADVVRALHEATKESFVVDADVRGRRLTFELAAVTVDDATRELAKAGLRVGPGPLRRVSLASAPHVESTQEYTGDPINLSLGRGDVRDLFRLLEELTGLPILVPATGLRGEVAIFTQEVAWDRAFDGIVAAAGLAWTLEGDKVYVGSPAQLSEPTRQGFVPIAAAAAEAAGRDWWTAAEGRRRP
jgi:hypothetical protein